jgi:hypothetical protein
VATFASAESFQLFSRYTMARWKNKYLGMSNHLPINFIKIYIYTTAFSHCKLHFLIRVEQILLTRIIQFLLREKLMWRVSASLWNKTADILFSSSEEERGPTPYLVDDYEATFGSAELHDVTLECYHDAMHSLHWSDRSDWAALKVSWLLCVTSWRLPFPDTIPTPFVDVLPLWLVTTITWPFLPSDVSGAQEPQEETGPVEQSMRLRSRG